MDEGWIEGIRCQVSGVGCQGEVADHFVPILGILAQVAALATTGGGGIRH